MTPTNARKTKSAAIPTSVPMKNSDTPYEDQMIMNNKKIIGKQFYRCSTVDKEVPEIPQNLEEQKRGSRKSTRGLEMVTTAVPFQNKEKQPKRKRVKQSKRKRVKSSNQQDEAVTQLVPSPFDPRTSGPPLPVPLPVPLDKQSPKNWSPRTNGPQQIWSPWTNGPQKFSPHGQTVPKQFSPRTSGPQTSNQQDETQREVVEESNKRRWRRRSRARRKVETFGGASSSVVGTICPLPVEIAFPNDLPKIGGVSGTSGSAIPVRRRPNKKRPNERIDANKIFPTNQVNLDLFPTNQVNLDLFSR